MNTLKAPQKSIDAYLYNGFNIEIYECLAEGSPWHGVFEPLEFYNLLYSSFEFFRTNSENYLDIKAYFEVIELDDKQLYFFLLHLTFLIEKHKLIPAEEDTDFFVESNKVVIKSYDFLVNKFKTIKKDFGPFETSNDATFFKWEFEKTKEHLETLPSVIEKIKYLYKEKADYEQCIGEISLCAGPSYIQKCEVEINHLKELLELEEKGLSTRKHEPILISYTNSQLVLIFYYFLKSCGVEPRVSADVAPIAKFLHLITGKNFTTVANSDFYKKLQHVPNFKKDKELIKDLEAIKPMFQTVQLTEVVKMIDNEIDMARSQIKLKNEVF